MRQLADDPLPASASSRNGHARPPAPRAVVESGGSLVLIVAAVLCATLIQTLDATIVNVALPVIQGNLGATIDQGAWVVTGYIISAVIIIPLTPWLQQRFGRRQYYGSAVIGFTIASVLCGLSSSIESLIFWRIVQGAFGGGLIAAAQSTLRDTFPREQMGLSQGLLSIGAILGPAAGPTLGGWLTDNFSWNDVFLINVVPGAFASFVILTRLKNPADPKPVPVDAVGVALLILGLGSLQYVLGEGQRNDWFDDNGIRVIATLGAVGIASFIVWELFGTQVPITDLRVLRFRAVAAGSGLAFAMGASLYGSMVILPQFTEDVLHFTAMLSGQLIFTRAICIALGMPIVIPIAGRGPLQRRILIITGFCLIAVGQAWLSIVTTSGTDFLALIGPNVVCGFGLSMLFVPIALSIMSAIPPQYGPKAAAFQSLSQQLGGSIATAALVTLLARRTSMHQDGLAANVRLDYGPIAQFINSHGSIAQLYAQVVQEANAFAYADVQLAVAGLALISVPLVFLLPRRNPSATTALPELPSDRALGRIEIEVAL